MKKRTIAGILISIIFLYFAFRKVDFDELSEALAGAQYLYLIPVFVLAVLSLCVRALRWQYLLLPVKRISFGSLFTTATIGLMVNNLLPARLGEFVRAYLIGERENISKSAALATIVIERIFDGLAILMILIYAFAFRTVAFPHWFNKTIYIVIGLYGLAIIFLILLRLRSNDAMKISNFLTRPLPAKVRAAIARALDSFVHGLEIIHNFKELIISFVLSVLVWVPNVVIVYILLRAFGIDLPFHSATVVFIIIAIGTMIPSAPGFVGTIQYCSVIGLAIFSVPKSIALSFSIVYHIGVFIPVTGTGLICLLLNNISLVEIRKLKSEGEEG